MRTLSVVFLTYNRADLLMIAVDSLRRGLSKLTSLSYEIVIADDCSDAGHRELIDRLHADKVISPEKNLGLSSNHNRALRASKNDAVLSLQDDWQFIGEPSCLEDALQLLEQDSDVGVVNFMSPTTPLAHEARQLDSGRQYQIFYNDGINRRRDGSARPYSDRPHLKRKDFIRDIGPYREDMPMTTAELDFQRRVACQDRWKIAYMVGDAPFVHLGGSRSFNPGNERARKREQIYRLPVIGPVYRVARMAARLCRNSIVGE
jgi:GT2 family glycosyltransferase